MVTVKQDGAIKLKRSGLTYFVLINGLNVFEIEGDYEKAVEVFNRKVLNRGAISDALKKNSF